MEKNDKYVVFPRDLFERKLWALGREASQSLIEEIKGSEVVDAVVIRRQDVFAPPAFDAYASSILIAREIAEMNGNHDLSTSLRKLADYFHAQATLSYDTHRKLPD